MIGSLADLAAAIRSGSLGPAMDALRDQRGLPWLDDLRRDVRHGLRSLRRSPGFTTIALVTLALGIGANTAIFSILNGVILRPLNYPRPEQLMRLTGYFPVAGSTGTGLSHPEYVEFREMNRSFAEVGAFTTGGGTVGGGGGAWSGEVNIRAGDRPLRVRSAAESFGNVARGRPRGVAQLVAEVHVLPDLRPLDQRVDGQLQVAGQLPAREIVEVPNTRHAPSPAGALPAILSKSPS